MDIHPSHVMVAVPINNAQECKNCWNCTCHHRHTELTQPCPDAE